ncbi:MAG: amino acid ABC transporter permease/ATP-binding protein [Vulcanimicrobiaceae bacterium]
MSKLSSFIERLDIYLFSWSFCEGALVTLAVTIAAMALGIVLGLLAALAKSSKLRWLRASANFYIWLFRGTPVLLQLIFVYAGLPQLGLRFSSFQCAVIALSLNEGAYMAEIIRAGIEAIHSGQTLAARALGMSELQVKRFVVLPQAFRIIIPPTGNQFIGMLKTSALASVVAVRELLLNAQETAAADFQYIPTFTAAACYYLLLTTVFSHLQGRLERRLSIGGRRRAAGAGLSEGLAPPPADRVARHAKPQETAIVKIDNLTKSYQDHRVLNAMSISIRTGESLVIVGPSGSGKSTLLRCIAGLETPDEGTIQFMGQNVHEPGTKMHRVRADIGVVFQSFNLFPHMTALENIMLAPVRVRGVDKSVARNQALQLLSKVHLLEKADSYPEELSGGQQQRVAIARALAMEPAVMLFDEATSALDPEMTREVLDVMVELIEDGLTVVVVTHEMGFARRAADRIIFIDHGEIVEDSTTDAFFKEARHPRAQQFMREILSLDAIGNHSEPLIGGK